MQTFKNKIGLVRALFHLIGNTLICGTDTVILQHDFMILRNFMVSRLFQLFYPRQVLFNVALIVYIMIYASVTGYSDDDFDQLA